MRLRFPQFLAIALALITGAALAAPRLQVGTDESLPPFSFVRDGQAVGIDVDMLRTAATRLGLNLDIVPLPWKRVLALTENGELPLAMPLFRTAQRETFAKFTGPVHVSQSGLFVKKGREFPFASIDDLAGKRLGINRGFVFQDDLDRAIREGKIVTEEVGTIDQNLRKLLAERIDAFAVNVVSARYVLRGSPMEAQLTVLPHLLNNHRPAFLVISRVARIPERDRLAADLQSTLEELHRDGTYQRIVERYLVP